MVCRSIDFYAPGVGQVKEVYAQAGDRYGYDRVPLQLPDPRFGAAQFTADGYSETEEAGTFPESLVRGGGSTSVVAVEFAMTASTVTFTGLGPVFGDDWKIVSLAPGQTWVVFDVAIHDDAVWNNRRTLDIELDNPLGGAELGVRTTAQVNVEEAESGTDAGTFIGSCFLDTLLLQ